MANLAIYPMNKEKTLREGIHGTWHYHYATEDGKEALCGAATMCSNAPESTWGFKGNAKERYCSKCQEIKSSLNLNRDR